MLAIWLHVCKTLWDGDMCTIQVEKSMETHAEVSRAELLSWLVVIWVEAIFAWYTWTTSAGHSAS